MNSSIKISFPKNTSVKFLKQLGDIVKAGDEIAKIDSSKKIEEIDVSRSCLIKRLGDAVNPGEIIAFRKKGIFFKKKVEIKSTLKGKIIELDDFSGKMKIIDEVVGKIVRAPISGKIKEENEERITIEFKGEEAAVLKTNYEVQFPAEIVKMGKFEEEVDESKIDADAAGKVLLGGHFSRSDLNRSLAVGAAGAVAGAISDDDFSCSLPIFLLNKENFSKLEHHKAESLFFDGSNKRIIMPR